MATNDGPSDCTFSEDRVYRYVLRHEFDKTKISRVNFIMLNPSTADESQLDPTLRRCKGFARQWGYGGFVITNLFAFRATSPLDMKAAADPIGLENDRETLIQIYKADLIVLGWGSHGGFLARDKRVLKMALDYGKRVCHLGLTGAGQPRHPLYLGSGVELTDWTRPSTSL